MSVPPTPPQDLAPPSTLGRYRLVRRLARGGMAELFFAVLAGPEGFEKPVVVKRMLPALAGQEEYRQMFAQEARLMGALQHPNLVAALDFGADAGAPFLVLEHVDGVDLGRALAACGPVPVALVRHLGLSLLRALEHLHGLRDAAGQAMGVVHRDLSPANVLLGRAGEVKLADFGIAKGLRAPSRTAPGSARGKLAYMSPEQLRGASLDGRADLFSLGVLLHEAALGESPYDARTDAELLLAVRDVRLVPPERLIARVGAELAAVILRALRAHPAERFASAAEMAEALGAAVIAEPDARHADPVARVAALVADAVAAEEAAAAGVKGAADGAGRARSPLSATLFEVRGDD